MPRNLHLAIVHINEQLEAFVARCNIPNVTFCDVHKGMRGDDLYMRPGLYLPDGVHFAIEGNRACGECIAAKIYEVLR